MLLIYFRRVLKSTTLITASCDVIPCIRIFNSQCFRYAEDVC